MNDRRDAPVGDRPAGRRDQGSTGDRRRERRVEAPPQKELRTMVRREVVSKRPPMQDVIALVRKGVEMKEAIRIVAVMHGLGTLTEEGAALDWKLKELNSILFLAELDRQGRLPS
jgi:hypothetical protein